MKQQPLHPARAALPHRESLVAQTISCLRAAISAGEWREALPGERVLADRLHVSRVTIRAALEELRRTGVCDVSHGARRRIIKAPTRRVSSPCATIGLLSPLPHPAVPPQVMYWIDQLRGRVGEDGHRLHFHHNLAAYRGQPWRALRELVRSDPCAAWVLWRSTPQMQHWFSRSGIPAMLVGTCAPEVQLPYVDIDYRAACRHAAGLLLSRQHLHLAFVVHEKVGGGDEASLRGLAEAIAQHPVASLTTVRHDDMPATLCARLDVALSHATPPTGFIVARSQHVLTVLTHLLRRDRRIPEDAAIISRDDDPFLDFLVPAIARYAIAPARISTCVSRVVTRLLADEKAGSTLLMPRYCAGASI